MSGPTPGADARSAARTATIAVFFGALAAFLLALAAHKPLDHDEHQFVASGALLAREGFAAVPRLSLFLTFPT
jgi:hypothetical protein